MRIGYRITKPRDVGLWEADLVQVSVFRGMRGGIGHIEECARACSEAGVPYVLHPVCYPLLDRNSFDDLRAMAGCHGMALILHDERASGGGRLGGREEGLFLEAVRGLEAIAPVSFENAVHTPDAPWFWARYARSVTIDIGHIEAAGLNSVRFVSSLEDECIDKVEYVHMHVNGPLRRGLTDHWPLSPACREIDALRALLLRKNSVSVILEINETEEIGKSLDMLRALRDELGL